MSEKDGLFENPNQNEEQNIEEQKRDTLLEIKDDTSSILDVLNNFGGRQIELLAQSEKQAKARHLSDKRANDALVRALKTPKTADKVQSENKAKSPQLPAGEKAGHSKAQAQNNAPKPAAEKGKNTAGVEPQKTKPEQTSPEPKLAKKKKNKPAAEKKEQLPNGWQRDKDGRVRDQKGRYVKEDELAKHGIKNPPKEKDGKNAEDETADLARDHALLDALKDVKDAVESPDNLDPLIDGVKEVTAPLGAAFDISKTVASTAGRGFGKLFGDQNKEQRWRDRLLNRFTKFAKTKEKSDEHQVSWLKRIWKKPNGPGLLSRLLSGLGGLLRLPLFFARLPLMLVGGLGKLLLGGLGSIFKGGKGLFGGIGKLGAGLFGGLGKLGKGFLKKIPILGALFALGDGVGGLFDDTRDENGKSNRGKRVGSAAGTAIGGLIGSAFGPIGTIAGAMIGDWLGEKIGAWVADFDWSVLTNKISRAWDASVEWIKSTWNSIDWSSIGAKISAAWNVASNWIKTQWDSIDWGTFGEKVGKIWDSVTGWIKSTWDKLDLSGAWESTKNAAGKIQDTGLALAGKAVNGAKATGRAAKDWVVNKVTSTYETVSGWFSSGNNSAEATQASSTNQKLEEANAYQEESIKETTITNEKVSLSNELLDNIFTTLNDILAFLKEKLTALNSFNNGTVTSYPLTENGVPMSSTSSGNPNLNLNGKGDAAKARDAYIEIARKNGASEQDIHFALANMARETGDFTHGASENMNYTSAERIMAVHGAKIRRWGGDVNTLVRNPEALANVVYADKNGSDLGNIKAGDGWRYRGRGLVQLTGRGNYARYGKMIGEDLENNPDLVNDPIIAAKVADAYLRDRSYGKDFSRFSAGIIGDVVGNPHGRDALMKGQDKLNAVAKFMQKSTPDMMLVNQPIEKSADLLAQSPTVQPIGGMVIPEIKPPKDTTKDTILRVEQETAKKSTALQQTTQTTAQNAPRTPDPVLQFLTQDVSDRRIAHIVTGGIAQKGRV